MGDIVQGFSEIIPDFLDNLTGKKDISISILQHNAFVILSPCCSIEQKEAILTPLLTLDQKFLQSDYLLNDFTSINREIKKRDAIGEFVYNKQPDSAKIAMDNAPPAFEFLEKFVIAGHPLLDKYRVKNSFGDKGNTKIIDIETNDYMISFKRAFRVSYPAFVRGSTYCCKLLEMTPLYRSDLRAKLQNFFGRVPDEDRASLVELNSL